MGEGGDGGGSGAWLAKSEGKKLQVKVVSIASVVAARAKPGKALGKERGRRSWR